MDNSKEFQISVADVVGEDIETGQTLFVARTLLNSSLKQDVQNKEIQGGYGSKLQYEYDYGKKLTGDIEDCQFKETYMAMVNGQQIRTELSDFWIWEEKHTVKDGKITIDEIPLGKVVVENEEEMLEVTPNNKEVAVPFKNDTEVICSYQYNTSVDTFDIDGEHFGKTIKVTYISRIFKKGGLFKVMQIEIPRFKLAGGFEINLSHDGASTSKLSGKALEYNGRYAKVKVKRVDGKQIPIQHLVSVEPEVNLNNTETETLSFIGIRGGLYGNIPISNSEINFISDDDSIATVDTNGVITYKSNGIANITASLKENTNVFDVIKVTCS